MSDLLTWIVILLLGGFFTGIMFYSFYLVLFSKSDKNLSQKTKKEIQETPDQLMQSKFIGRT